MQRREVDLVILSDVHLGTYGCHARELLHYLKSIAPKKIILNGDIIDIWQFSKRYWPETHMRVVHELLKFVSKGIDVHYLTGNHDELLRKFAGFELGSLSIANKLTLDLGKQRAWVFHGDVFDVTMQHSKWLARLGAVGYDMLILLNRSINWMLTRMGRERMSLSKKIKNSIKNAVKFINDFEQTASDLAAEKGYGLVICGHIHQPEIRTIQTDKGEVTYLNSGDWVENLTALEYHGGDWRVYRYDPATCPLASADDAADAQAIKSKLDIDALLAAFHAE